MRNLNEKQETQLNETLKQFQVPEVQPITVKAGNTIVYQGVLGQTPTTDRITSEQLENLRKAVYNPEQSRGTIKVSSGEQVYRIQDGKIQDRSLQPLQPVEKATTAPGDQLTKLQSSVDRLLEETVKQRGEIASLREALKQQSELLQKASTPIHKRLGNWFEQSRNQVSNRVQEFQQSITSRVQEFRSAVKQQTQNVAARAVTEIVERAGERQADGSVLLRANGQNYQSPPKENQPLPELQTNQNTSQPNQEDISARQQEDLKRELARQELDRQNQDQARADSDRQLREREDRLAEQARADRLRDAYEQRQAANKPARTDRVNENQVQNQVQTRQKIETEPRSFTEILESIRPEKIETKPQLTQPSNQPNNTSYGPVLVLNQNGNIRWKHQERPQQSERLKEAIQASALLADKPNVSQNSSNAQDDFLVSYNLKRASDEQQLKAGIIPPQSITPAGVWLYHQVAAEQKAELVDQVLAIKLKELGQLSPQQTDLLRQEVVGIVEKDWQEENSAKIKAWQESQVGQNLASTKSKSETQVQENRADNSNKVDQQQQQQPRKEAVVKIADLEAWRKEAEAIGRSEIHLNKIDNLIAHAQVKATAGNQDTVKFHGNNVSLVTTIMGADRRQFTRRQIAEQNQPKAETEAPIRPIRGMKM